MNIFSKAAPNNFSLTPMTPKTAQYVLIYGTALLSVMGVAIIFPVLPAMAQHFHIEESQLGVLVYSFTLPGIFLAPVGGILADRWGRKAVLLPCLFLFALGGFLASFATTLPTLLFWRVIQGMGAACLGVLYTTIVGDIYHDEHERLKIMGFAATTLSLGAALFPALGGLLGEVGWAWSLRLSLLALPLLWLGLYTPLPTHEKKGNMRQYATHAKKIIFQKQSLLHFAITFCAFSILYGPLISYFPLFSTTYYAASPMQIGLVFALSSLGTVLATLVLSPIVKFFSQKTVACAGALFFGLAMTMLFFWSKSLSFWWLIIPIFCYGVGQGLLYPIIIASLSALAPTVGRGALMAVNGTILRLSQSIAPLLCGALFLYGAFTSVFFFGMFMALTMLILTLMTFISRKNIDISS